MPRLLVEEVYVGGGSYKNQLTLEDSLIDDFDIIGEVELTEDELAKYVNLLNDLQCLTAELLGRTTALKRNVAEDTYDKYESYALKFE